MNSEHCLNIVLIYLNKPLQNYIRNWNAKYLVSIIILDNGFASGVMRRNSSVAVSKRHLQTIDVFKVIANIDVVKVWASRQSYHFTAAAY